MQAREDRSHYAGMVYLLMLIGAIALGGAFWLSHRPPEIPHIAAPPEPYKVRPPEAPPLDDGERGTQGDDSTSVGTWPDEPPGPPPPPPPPRSAPPYFVANGPYVAQLVALRSEAGVDEAWRRLSSRAPRLFERARLDVEHADLGPRGVYYRVRAGYFPDRANATRFCERVRRMGQDCVVTAR